MGLFSGADYFGWIGGLIKRHLAAFAVFYLAQGLAQAVESPQRVISLSPHITELVFAAGGGNRLVAVDNYSDWPAQTASLPKVGDAFSLNIEHLVSLKPDLVLIWGSGTNSEKKSQLDRVNIPTLSFEPSGLESIADDIETLGVLFKTSSTAERSAGRYRSDIKRLSEEYAALSTVTTFYQIQEQPLYTIGGGHLISEAISLCGGINIFADLTEIAPPVNKEALITRKPQLIVSAQKNDADKNRVRKSWAKMPFIPAVAKGNIRFVNPDLLTRPGPRLALGIEELCVAIQSAR